MKNIASWATPRLDLGGCVLYLPLWRQELVGYESGGFTIFYSMDSNRYLCQALSTSWTYQGRTFDGSAINCTSAATLDNIGRGSTPSFSIEAWIKPSSAGGSDNGRIVDKSKLILYMNTDNRVSFSILVGASTKTVSSLSSAVAFGAWSHVVAVYDNVTPNLYTNLNYRSGSAVSGQLDDHSSATMMVGNKEDLSRDFEGVVGEVRIYTRALTASEVARNYQATKWRYLT